jgi:small basic protein
MFDELHRHKLAYFILTLVLGIHIGLFFVFWPNKIGMRIISISLATSYFSWGIFAHVKAQHINRRIVREYFFSALLAAAMLLFLTW